MIGCNLRGCGRPGPTAAAMLLALTMAALPSGEAFALITGGEGNKPIADPGWPKGAAAIFNHPGRIAWWEGPPFGGGQWHAECRGGAGALSVVLADFAGLDVKTKRVVVHDGVGRSFWLDPNRVPAKREAARMDWSFTVWQPANWEQLRKLPADLNPVDPDDSAKGPPSQIDVFTGGGLRWADVHVPEGIEVVDQRLEAHGFTAADGHVIEGKVVDEATQRPLAARVQLQRVEPQPKGGYRYPVAAEAAADAQGRWVLKKAPAGWNRVVVAADGYVPRVVGHVQFDDEPRWSSYDGELARPGPVSGRVTDEGGRPLSDVEVRFGDVVPAAGGRYQSPHDDSTRTDADGRFGYEGAPIGRATIWVRKPGYCRPGLGLPIKMPAGDVALSMRRSARIRITVDFDGKPRLGRYIAEIEPEGGSVIGSWGGSGFVDAEGRITFEDVPPGRYSVRGRPNPSTGAQAAGPIMIDLTGGQSAEITLKAK
jgi:hypothetical protein